MALCMYAFTRTLVFSLASLAPGLLGSASTHHARATRAPLPHSVAASWLKLNADPCGQLSGIKRELPFVAAAEPQGFDDPDFEDDEGSSNAWDMTEEDSFLVEQWFRQHPNVAPIADAIENSCTDASVTLDEPDLAVIA